MSLKLRKHVKRVPKSEIREPVAIATCDELGGMQIVKIGKKPTCVAIIGNTVILS